MYIYSNSIINKKMTKLSVSLTFIKIGLAISRHPFFFTFSLNSWFFINVLLRKGTGLIFAADKYSMVNSHHINIPFLRTMENKWLFSTATAAFLMLTLLTLIEDGFSHTAFRIVLVIYSFTMMGVEASERKALKEEGYVVTGSRVLAVLGYLTFLEAAYSFSSYNQGNIYMIASFLITCSALLKSLQMVISKSLTLARVLKRPYQFLRISSLAGVGLFFFVTSVAEGLKDQYCFYFFMALGKGSNILAGILHVIALYNLHKEEGILKMEKIKFESSDGQLFPCSI